MGIADPQLDKLITDARADVDPASRAAKNLQIQRHIAENAYVIQTYQYPLRWEIWWNYAKGYMPLAANIRSFVRTTWVKK
jgi:peptide/nickel transport system substrate-binding protein